MRFLIISLFVFIGMTFVSPVLALEPGGLVTCDGAAFREGPNSDFVSCNFCKFMAMVEKVTKYLVVLLILVATIMFAITGVQMAYTAAGGSDARQILKDRLTNIVIGFFLIIAAYTIVDTLLKALVTDGQIRDHWKDYLTLSVSELCFEPLVPSAIPRDLPKIAIHDETEFDPAGLPGGFVTDLDVSEEGMVLIPGEEEKASPDTVRRFVEMREAAAREGIILTVNDGHRSEERQAKYWDARGCNENPSKCAGKVARPRNRGGNGSNHNRGIALDLQTPYNSAAYNWMKRNGAAYGFRNEIGARDPWHWSPSGH